MSRARTILEAKRAGEWTEPAKGHCRWCKGPITAKRRTSFCSGSEAKFELIFVAGEGKVITGIVAGTGEGCVHEFLVRSRPQYARKCVWARDRGVCATCGKFDKDWEADHVLAVVEGGGLAGLEALRTLCTTCHKAETKSLAGRRAATRVKGALPATISTRYLRRDGSMSTHPAHVLTVVEVDLARREIVCANRPSPYMHWRFPLDGGPVVSSWKRDAPRDEWEAVERRSMLLTPATLTRFRCWADRQAAQPMLDPAGAWAALFAE